MLLLYTIHTYTHIHIPLPHAPHTTHMLIYTLPYISIWLYSYPLYIDPCYIPMLYMHHLYATHYIMYPCYMCYPLCVPLLYRSPCTVHTYIYLPPYKHRFITTPYCVSLYSYSYRISRAITERSHIPLYYVVYGTYKFMLIYPFNMYILV